ncbi:hypothetical protein LWM68_41280 [Niabella sp. W65]|nr:hypothetical protein [Niabella sp. W65]MCH7368606.1 hypothetical protein [Niabella sp. W65]ULT44194.1 hypothetical protein KRR40_12985 [Niabella sp. I65]
MQTAGIKVVAEWDATQVKQGVAELKNILGPKFGSLVIDNKGALKSLSDINKLLNDIVANGANLGPKMAANLEKGAKTMQNAINKGLSNSGQSEQRATNPKGGVNRSWI